MLEPQVLRLLIKLYESVPEPDWASICQCLMFLDNSREVAKILHNLLESTEVRTKHDSMVHTQWLMCQVYIKLHLSPHLSGLLMETCAL